MQTVLVTGATSGIGLSIATKLHQRGYTVFGTSRSPEKQQANVPFPLLPLDITSEESVKNCLAAFLDRSPVLDALINNAGMLVSGSAEETSLEQARQLMEANFWGAVRMTKAVMPLMRQQRKGRIITIGSLAGLIGVPFQSYYAASKHAIEGFYKSLRFEVSPFNIHVSVIEPGFFKSNLEQTSQATPDTIADYAINRTKALHVFSESINQASSPEPVADVALKILRSNRPLFSYRVGREANLLPLLQFMPYRFFEWGLIRHLNRDEVRTLEKTTNMANPIIRHTYTADPTALVYQDRVFLFTGHDEAPPGSYAYRMKDWLCFSSNDLVNWIEHPVPWQATDFAWAKGDAYASKIIERAGKFYFYAAVSHAHLPGKAIGVATASSPTGPFQDERGSALITHDMLPPTTNEKANLDPTVLVDDDDQGYIFWGNKQCYFARLTSDMMALNGPIMTVDLPCFEEGAHIHNKEGWYYLAYGYGSPEKVGYAMSRRIDGPWQFKGILNELAGNCETNRPCILDYQGESYFFYHNGALSGGGSQRRSVCVDYLYYNSDGSLKRIVMTSEGINPVR